MPDEEMIYRLYEALKADRASTELVAVPQRACARAVPDIQILKFGGMIRGLDRYPRFQTRISVNPTTIELPALGE